MFNNLRMFVTVICLAIPAWSAAGSGTISGYVRDSSGVPQMGAAVELLPLIGSELAHPVETLKAFTNDRGFYSIAKLLPGNYSLKVSEPSYLPTLREKIGVRAGARLMVNVTMTNLFEAIQLVTVPTQSDQDDWKWTLRAISNRPILRVLDDGTTAVVENGSNDSLKGSLAFLAGSPGEGFGSASDMSTAFSVERSLLSTGTIRLNGDLGYSSDGVTIPSTLLRTSYTGHFNDVSEPSFSLTALRLNSTDPTNTLPGAALQAVSLTSADRVVLGNSLEMRLGSELQTIQFLGHVRAFKPFGSADLHLSPNTVLEYQYRSSVPRLTLEDLSGDPSDPASSENPTGPRMSMTNFAPAVERARHQEVSLSQRVGKNNIQLAFFSDSIVDPVLTGIGGVSADSGDVLPDIFSGTFSYQGNNFSTRGMRVVLERKFLSDVTATLDYSYGGVLDLSRPDIQLDDARSFMRTENRRAVAAKLRGTVPKSKTRWIASYRYANRSLTPVDLFNTSAGQSDPYFNLFVRQPIPSSFLAGHLELLIDLRNLLAQGYVPVIGQDGHTVYLVQSARSVRGGLAFNF
jgi:hypothetical protein